MLNPNCIDLASLTVEDQPFPHFSSASALQNNIDLELYNWLVNTEHWKLIETDFYEQHEFSLLCVQLPKYLECLISRKTIEFIKAKFKTAFKIESFELVGVVAHKLVNEQHIGIHNDFIKGDETHRLVIHLNPEWNEEKGGFLMLFNSSNAEDISTVISPLNNTAFGFEISDRSHHAVSRIYDFSRYTVVYTFKKI